MADPVQDYVDGIEPDHRPAFDRIDGLIRDQFPEVEVVISYDIPTYRVGKRKLYLGSWAHGVSLYGWSAGADDGFVERHPELRSGKGTIKLTPDALARVGDDELVGLIRATLSPAEA